MDNRTLRQKLEAMAERGTDHEREVARAKLAAMDDRIPPPPPPTRNAAPAPEPGWYWTTTGTMNTGSVYFESVRVTIHFTTGS